MAQRPTTIAAIPVLLAGLLLLAACGNRGSLYLPDEEPAAAPSAANVAGDDGTPGDTGEDEQDDNRDDSRDDSPVQESS